MVKPMGILSLWKAVDRIMAYSLSVSLLEAKEKKKERNRIAQRTYRHNQKLRLRALEDAVGISRSQASDTYRSQSPNTIASRATSTSRNDTPFQEVVSQHASPSFIPSCPASPQVTSSSFATPPDVSITPPQNALFSPSEKIDLWTPMLDPVLSDDTLASQSVALSRSALHRAVSANNDSMTRLLLDRGADSRKLDSNGQSALHLAVDAGNERVIKAILEKNVHVSVKDSLGRTALYQAVLNENEKITKMLLDAKVDVNSRDAFGEVVLYLAVEKGLENFVFLLLSHGADIEA